jgi:DNA-binding transcriptional regulator YiaG
VQFHYKQWLHELQARFTMNPMNTPKITVNEAAAFCNNNKSELARQLGVSRQAVQKWGEYLPPLRAYQLRDLGFGKARTITE